MKSTCRQCQGTRVVIKNPCMECHGKGSTVQRKQVTVPVPAGILLFHQIKFFHILILN